MSKRSVKKRRHRDDFQGYMHQRTVEKVAGGPMWQRLGFPTQAAYQAYLDSKPKDSQMQLPPAHVHGPDCHHGEISGAYVTPESLNLPQSVADAMPDDTWVEEPNLTAEEAGAFAQADHEEGEPF
jgi:hypothetical protein